MLLPLVSLFLALKIALCGPAERDLQYPNSILGEHYEIEFSNRTIPHSEVVEIAVNNTTYKCQIPATYDPPAGPIITPEKVAAAKAAINDLKSIKRSVYFDDIWAWDIGLFTRVKQLMPRRKLNGNAVEMAIDSRGTSVGQFRDSIENAEALIIDQQIQLLARYTNGTKCDLTFKPRSLNVYFVCDPSADEEYRLLSAEEPQANCLYEMVVGVRELCNIEGFTKTGGSKIVCN